MANDPPKIHDGKSWERVFRKGIRDNFKIKRPWERPRTEEERQHSQIYLPDYIVEEHYIVDCKSTFSKSITLRRPTIEKMFNYRDKFLPNGECIVPCEFRDFETMSSEVYILKPTIRHQYILNKNKLKDLSLNPDIFGLGKELTLEEFFTSLPEGYTPKS